MKGERNDVSEWSAKCPQISNCKLGNIVAEVKPANVNENDKSEDIADEASARTPYAHAFKALKTAMSWLEMQYECFITQLLLLKRLRDMASNKRTSPCQKKTFVVLINKIYD